MVPYITDGTTQQNAMSVCVRGVGACVCWLYFAFLLTFGIGNSLNLLFFHFEIISNLQKVIRIIQRIPVSPLLTKFSPIFHLWTHLFSLSEYLTFILYTSIEFTYVFRTV